MTTHSCDALVVACIDFRFQSYIRDWLTKQMKGKTYDYVGFAGSTKSLDTIMGQLDISVRLHQIKTVVLIHHEDCGAYGAESTAERHALDLRAARTAVVSRYADLHVELYYLHLDGTFEQVV